MRIQLNLLPAVKLEYIKIQTIRNRISRVAFLASAISLGILIVMIFSVEIIQKKQLSDGNKQITAAINNIQSQPQITRVLTVQNQLKTLVTLHESKHVTSRVFDYLSQVTPPNANLARLSIDYGLSTITIDGTADSAATVNKFVDTLKFTKYTVGSDSTALSAFPSVVETNFNISSSTVSYSLNVQFDPSLFSNKLKNGDQTATPKLQVPTQATTRSTLDPGSLFGGGR